MYELPRSALRAKRGMQEHCWQFSVEPFPSEDEWKDTREFEGVLRETSRLTKMSQNEGELNSVRRPAMRKALHDSLSRDDMSLADVDDWSSDKKTNTSY